MLNIIVVIKLYLSLYPKPKIESKHMDDQSLIDSLKSMLKWKASKSFYAKRLNTSEEVISHLIDEINNKRKQSKIIDKIEENIDKGTRETTFHLDDKIETLDDLIKKCNIDTKKWTISRYIQNYWGNSNKPYWQVKVWLQNKDEKQLFQENFISFLSTYIPAEPSFSNQIYNEDNPHGCLIINKQDAHLNRLDFNNDNSIQDRFGQIFGAVSTIIYQASSIYNIDKIIYVIGADEFNSEWTNTTTKGTPQENIGTYHSAFEDICTHNIHMITLLLSFTREVEVIYIPGNHDEYVGWHLVSWLSAYFKKEQRIKFDVSPKYRKYVSYGNSALVFNHGDSIKPEKLATIFPVEYKKDWSEHKHFYGFIADKHHEVTKDINGITFYQLPAYATSSSRWEDKNGYVGSKAEATGFLIDNKHGITNIFKQYI